MQVINDLYKIIEGRKNSVDENSYTCYLFKQGMDKILKKLGEETAETIIAAKNGDETQIVNESCDLLYHLMVMLIQSNVSIEAVEKELLARSEKIGNLKVFKNTDKNT